MVDKPDLLAPSSKGIGKQIEFFLKPEHLKLMRKMCVGWDDCEYGAPEIDPKRPYGNSNVLHDLADIIGIEYDDEKDEPLTSSQIEYLEKLHKETETALQVALESGQFKVGRYVKREYCDEWKESPAKPVTDYE
jgi:hypothetical protein